MLAQLSLRFSSEIAENCITVMFTQSGASSFLSEE